VASVDAYEAPVRAHLALSEVGLASADVDGAVSAARQAVDIAATGDWLVLNAEARLGLARALAAAGDSRGAESHARSALEMHRAKEHALGVTGAEAFLRSIVATSA